MLEQSCIVNVPLNIFQTWHTKTLPIGMAKSALLIKKLNPRFNYYLYDDNDCYEFIKNNYDESVLNAYNRIIPGAYKADLWRYCILYKKGGLYLDIKYVPINNFRFINLMDSEHLVYDIDNSGIYNALMICKPGSELLLKAINKIVENVNNRFYGDNYLEPTGPTMLKKLIENHNLSVNVDLNHSTFSNNNTHHKFIIISKSKLAILRMYNGYFTERDGNSKAPHYIILWKNKQIYK
jgi:mannosyltransferase OCH1-like enzyme